MSRKPSAECNSIGPRPVFRFFSLLALSPLFALAQDVPPPDQQRLREEERARVSLRALPYLSWSKDLTDANAEDGVLHHDRDSAHTGINLFSVPTRRQAFAMDMEGRIVHRWRLDQLPIKGKLQYVRPAPDGNLLGIVYGRALLKIDPEGRLLWSVEERFHHDVVPGQDDQLVSLVYRASSIKAGDQLLPILDDVVVFIDQKGKIQSEMPLLPILRDYIPDQRLERIRSWLGEKGLRDSHGISRLSLGSDTPPDVLHSNSIEVLSRDSPGLGEKGDLLLSVRELDSLFVIDVSEQMVRWSWGPDSLGRQHDASLLENGNILVFNNRSEPRGSSSVLEINPHSKKVVWSWKADPPQDFFSFTRGAAQRLPNGNTLITESDRGQAFEVAPTGEIVWFFATPVTRTAREGSAQKKQRAGIYRLERFSREKLLLSD